MQIVTRTLAPLAVVLALAAPSAAARSAGGETVLAISSIDRRVARLVELDSASLKATGKGLGAEGFAGAWSFSRDRSRLALSNSYVATLGRPAGLLIVDVESLREVKRIRIPAELGFIRALAWVGPERLVALVVGNVHAGTSVLTVDAGSGRVIARRRLEGTVMGGVHRPDGFVLLVARARGIGPARVVTVDAELRIRSVTLARVQAGWAQRREPGDVSVQQREPGLAVDASGGRAFVVGAGEPVAEVDLRTLRTSYRAYGRAAQARAKSVSGPVRQAEWLGNGLLAVAGWRWEGLDQETRLVTREPAGLRILDTRNGTERVLDAGAQSFTVVGGVLVVGEDGRALSGYAPDGRRLYAAYEGRRFEVSRSVGDRLLVRLVGETSTRIVDARTGRELGLRPGATPYVLATARSPIL